MTDEKRRSVIQSLIREHTAASTVDRATARKALIDEGIYTRKGALRAEFGGNPKKAKDAA